ncbi:hypothetical protein HaLaN_00988 [Haematococcus lacustris]|uniref:Uncharacterized protein n=1 Tax=Haematococcus lacustris TaxID=44745 RepID=A0A699YAL4_HAELA|nr:hypothetical protein HaLaN_00988 [Haematococcus lacustris]
MAARVQLRLGQAGSQQYDLVSGVLVTQLADAIDDTTISKLQVAVDHSTALEVFDIGMSAPLQLTPFLRRLSFEEDREVTRSMSFVAHHTWRQAGLLGNPGPERDEADRDAATMAAAGSHMYEI